jgi:uncharacterized protein (DUF433 family)
MSINIGAMIVNTPGTVGGRPRIEGTRVPVSAIAVCYKQGYLPEEIVQQFERLSIAQVYAALAYYHANQADIDADIAQEQALHEQLAAEQLRTRKPV